MTLDIKKKELQAIDVQIKARLSKKKDLENEIRILDNTKASLEEERVKVKKALTAVQEEYTQVKEKHDAFTQRMKRVEKENQSILDEVRAENDKLDRKAAVLSALIAKNSKIEAQCQSDLAQIKAERAQLDTKINITIPGLETGLSKREAQIQADKDTIKKDYEILDNRAANLEEDRNDLNEDKEVYHKQLQLFNESREAFEIDRKILARLKKDYADKINDLENRIVDVSRDRSSWQKKNEELKKAQDNHRRNVESLENDKREVRLQRLRVEKLIKDNNIDKELKELEKELG